MSDVEAGGAAPGATEVPEPRTPLKAIKNTTPMEAAAAVLAGGAVTTSVAAMIVASGPLVIPAGILSCLIGPYAWWQQTRLTDIKALKETHEAFQREVNTLKRENERLKKNVEELGNTVNRLEDVEEALEVITQTQGQSVEAFAEQVEENRGILARMQQNLKANVLQNLLTVVLRSDTDGDHQIDPEEIDDLITRMNSINGVKIVEDRFRKAILDSGGSLKAVMKVIKNLLNGDEDPENQIFVIEED
jgi:archaellum component FlaC